MCMDVGVFGKKFQGKEGRMKSDRDNIHLRKGVVNNGIKRIKIEQDQRREIKEELQKRKEGTPL